MDVNKQAGSAAGAVVDASPPGDKTEGASGIEQVTIGVLPTAVASLPPSGQAQGEIGFARLIGTATGVKLLVDTAVQTFNPFLALIAVGLGSDVVVLGRLISLRAIMGLFAPAFGALSGRWGYRRTIRLSLTLVGLGIIIVGLSPNVWVAALGMMVMGLGTGSFLPLLQAYLSGRLPYHRRARGLGILEYSWALAGIIGLPLVGLLIQATSWRVPLVGLGVLLLGAGFVVMRLPATVHEVAVRPPGLVEVVGQQGPGAPQPMGLGERVAAYFWLPSNVISTWATIAAGALNYFAAVQVMILYGIWLADRFGLGAAGLGTVALVFGLFDLAASVSVSLFTDRLGKRRAVLMGATVALLGYASATLTYLPLAGSIAVIGVTRFGFEFAIVSYFPLLSEQQRALRNKIMTLGSAISLTFATAAGFTAPWLYTTYGMQGVALVSGVATVLAICALLIFVREGGTA